MTCFTAYLNYSQALPPGCSLDSLDFCWDVWIGSELIINNTKGYVPLVSSGCGRYIRLNVTSTWVLSLLYAGSQSSSHLKLVSWAWQWVSCTQMASTVTRSQSSRAPLEFDSWQMCNDCVMLSCKYWPNSRRNIFNTLLNLFHEELSQLCSQMFTQPY